MKKDRLRRAAVCALFVAGIAVACGSARSEVPGKINYQGKLTDAQGRPLTAQYDMIFTLYDAATGGTAVWTEPHADVQIMNGMFNAGLGETAGLLPVVRAHDALFLEISIAGDTLSPRQELASAAYAMTGVPSGLIIMWSGTLAQIPTGWTLCDGANGTPDMRDRFMYGWTAGQNPGATGGAASHSHTYTGVVAHTHTMDPASATSSSTGAHTQTAASPGTHSHSVPGYQSYGSTTTGTANAATSTTTFAQTTSSAGAHTHTAQSAGAHTHAFDVASFASGSTGSASCTTASAEHLPPYRALAFIMKR